MTPSSSTSEGFVYLDYAASTPVDPEVLAAVVESHVTLPGNPHNLAHDAGRQASRAVERARERVAACIGGHPDGVVFTSGATESNNLALLGSVAGERGRHIVIAATEHKSVLATARHLRDVCRCELTELGVDACGRISPGELEAVLAPETTVVSLMWANNEIGTLHDVHTLGEVVHEHGALFHCDATQAVGRVPVDVESARVDLLSLSGHKLYGPMGTGALWVRPGTSLSAMTHGGPQERGLRPGTVNTPGIVGLGLACELAQLRLQESAEHLERLTERLARALLSEAPGARRISPLEGAVPGILNIAFEGVDSETLLMMLDGIALSAGAACDTHSVQPSHVLTALGLPPDLLGSCVRFSLGRPTTATEIDVAVERVTDAVALLRELTSFHSDVPKGMQTP